MTEVICDASIALKWFHDEGEDGVDAARLLLAAHRSARITASILDLTLYEIGNVCLRAFGWTASDVADQLDDLRSICPVLTMASREQRLAAELAHQHALTFYDGAYGAVARTRDAPFATADDALLRSGLGETPTSIAARLRLAQST